MFEQAGYRLELFAQKKESAKAFMMARDMSSKNAAFYSQKACSFGSAQGNILGKKTDDSIEIDLTKWRAVPHAPKGDSQKKIRSESAVKGQVPPRINAKGLRAVRTHNISGVKLILREDWEKIWKAKAVPEGVQAAFYWSLFPTQQVYAPTDYNWGGITVPLPAGTVFDLHIWWKRGATEYTGLIKGLKCRP